MEGNRVDMDKDKDKGGEDDLLLILQGKTGEG
jgi:hypothetical protein